MNKQAATRAERRTGFSLIEVVLALLIFAMGILAVLAILPVGVSQNADAETVTYASAFASRTLNGVIGQTMVDTGLYDRIYVAATNGCTRPMIVSTQLMTGGSLTPFWDTSFPSNFSVVLYTGVQTVVFRSADDPACEDTVFRYTLVARVVSTPRLFNPPASWEELVVTSPTPPYAETTNWAGGWWVRESEITDEFGNKRHDMQSIRLELTIYPDRYGNRYGARHGATDLFFPTYLPRIN
jgi:hypothetical protein